MGKSLLPATRTGDITDSSWLQNSWSDKHRCRLRHKSGSGQTGQLPDQIPYPMVNPRSGSSSARCLLSGKPHLNRQPRHRHKQCWVGRVLLPGNSRSQMLNRTGCIWSSLPRHQLNMRREMTSWSGTAGLGRRSRLMPNFAGGRDSSHHHHSRSRFVSRRTRRPCS